VYPKWRRNVSCCMSSWIWVHTHFRISWFYIWVFTIWKKRIWWWLFFTHWSSTLDVLLYLKAHTDNTETTYLHEEMWQHFTTNNILHHWDAAILFRHLVCPDNIYYAFQFQNVCISICYVIISKNVKQPLLTCKLFTPSTCLSRSFSVVD